MSYTKMLFGLKEGEERVKTLKKFIFFLITYNLIFIFILNLQYILRFNKHDDFFTMLIYSSSISIGYSIVPLVCFIFGWFISNSISISSKINSVLKSAILILITVISTYTLIELIVRDSIFTLVTITTILLTLFLFFFKYRKRVF